MSPITKIILPLFLLSACGSGKKDPAKDASVADTNIVNDTNTQDTAQPSDTSRDIAQADTADAGPPEDRCLPFDKASTATLRASKHKVFAHYFSPYPLSIDNKNQANDYYTQHYLLPEGENKKFICCGGLLRDRPLPRPASLSTTWALDNFKIEVQRAIAAGLDGFTYNILNVDPQSVHWKRLLDLLEATRQVDAGFKIALMPDMYAATFEGADADSQKLMVDKIKELEQNYSNVIFKSDNGRVVLAPYGVEKKTPTWWKETLARFTSENATVDFVPLFSNLPLAEGLLSYQKASVPMYGLASWGTRSQSGAPALADQARLAQNANLVWMGPIATQDMRPKSRSLWEANNSGSFRAQWESSIQAKADWIQIVTWNDYSKHTHISPSLHTGYAFTDLATYYIQQLKTGSAPSIARDRIYYYYRPHATTANYNAARQTEGRFEFRASSDPVKNEIEMVAFLKEPATLEISVSSRSYTKQAEAGLATLKAPLLEGTPLFKITRKSRVVQELSGKTRISNNIEFQDLMYRAGSLETCNR